MSSPLLGILFLTISVICFSGSVIRMRTGAFSQATTADTCTASLCGTDTKCCASWVNNQCRRGKVHTYGTGTVCKTTYLANRMTIGAAIVGMLFFIAAIYYLFNLESMLGQSASQVYYY